MLEFQFNLKLMLKPLDTRKVFTFRTYAHTRVFNRVIK